METTGIIVRKVNYGESDVIFTLYTAEGDMPGFFARGAKKLKSRYSGVVQLGYVVSVTYNKGRALNYPQEIYLDKRYVWDFYAKSSGHMNFYTDCILIVREIGKDMSDPHLYDSFLEAMTKAQKGNQNLQDVYTEFLNKVLHSIGKETELRCQSTGKIISEPECYYSLSSNAIFGSGTTSEAVNLERVAIDNMFIKLYYQRLLQAELPPRSKLLY